MLATCLSHVKQQPNPGAGKVWGEALVLSRVCGQDAAMKPLGTP